MADGAVEVLLFPEPGADRATWEALAGALDGGDVVASVDEGAPGANPVAAIRGRVAAAASSAVVVAAGSSALDALAAATGAEPPPSLVLLSPDAPAGEDYAAYRGEGASKLFLAGRGEVDVTEELARWSIGWTATVVFPSGQSRSALLAEWFDHIVDQVEGFVLQEAATRGGS